MNLFDIAGLNTMRIPYGIAWNSSKRNCGGGGRHWCVAAQSWTAAPATLTNL